MSGRLAGWTRACGAQIRLRLALFHAVRRTLDRPRQIVVLFIAVVVGQYTVGDPAAWIAPIRPLLLAPHPGAGGYLPCFVLALAVVGIGVAARPMFEWSAHSRYLSHLGSSRVISAVADAATVALLVLPIATMLTAGIVRSRVADDTAIATLAMSIVLLAAWLRIAARSSSLATAVVGTSVVAVASIGPIATGPVIVAVVAAVTVVTVAALVSMRLLLRRRPVGRRRWWSTRSPLADVWLLLHVDATRSRSPWMFVPTLTLAASIGWSSKRSGAPGDQVLLLAASLLLWQLAAAAKTAALAMDGWRRSRVLRQLPTRIADRATRVLVSSLALFVLASPAEAMSLHTSGNDAVAAWVCLAVAAPWITLWSQSGRLLSGVLSWSAMVGVTWLAVVPR